MLKQPKETVLDSCETIIQIKLDEPCRYCNGSGRFFGGICLNCKGKKIVLTSAGKQILNFLSRWKRSHNEWELIDESN